MSSENTFNVTADILRHRSKVKGTGKEQAYKREGDGGMKRIKEKKKLSKGWEYEGSHLPLAFSGPFPLVRTYYCAFLGWFEQIWLPYI
jgi:hypothetical protein